MKRVSVPSAPASTRAMTRSIAWCTDQGCGRTDPYPASGLGDADVVRAPQLQHAVEPVDRHVHRGRPPLIRMRAQPVADHLFPSADGGLGPGALRVPGCLL